MPSISDRSQDFIIANHVLEHADNALEVLTQWARTVRLGGNMFVTVPIAEQIFDRGRTETTLAHFVDDFKSNRNGNVENFRKNNLGHYVEWLSISHPAILAMSGQPCAPPSMEQINAQAKQLLSDRSEIHFHTFSVASFQQLLEFFCSTLEPDFTVAEIGQYKSEVIGVIHRKS